MTRMICSWSRKALMDVFWPAMRMTHIIYIILLTILIFRAMADFFLPHFLICTFLCVFTLLKLKLLIFDYNLLFCFFCRSSTSMWPRLRQPITINNSNIDNNINNHRWATEISALNLWLSLNQRVLTPWVWLSRKFNKQFYHFLRRFEVKTKS